MADLRQFVYSMLGQNNSLKNTDIVKHFVQSFRERTNYDIIKRYKIGVLAEDLPRSGRPTSYNGQHLKLLKMPLRLVLVLVNEN